nr:hypothetical protein [Tanacetum cinerariifolium]
MMVAAVVSVVVVTWCGGSEMASVEVVMMVPAVMRSRSGGEGLVMMVAVVVSVVVVTWCGGSEMASVEVVMMVSAVMRRW